MRCVICWREGNRTPSFANWICLSLSVSSNSSRSVLVRIWIICVFFSSLYTSKHQSHDFYARHPRSWHVCFFRAHSHVFVFHTLSLCGNKCSWTINNINGRNKTSSPTIIYNRSTAQLIALVNCVRETRYTLESRARANSANLQTHSRASREILCERIWLIDWDEIDNKSADDRTQRSTSSARAGRFVNFSIRRSTASHFGSMTMRGMAHKLCSTVCE